MKTTAQPLELIQIASPCEAEWKEMEGDERVRFCRLCKLHVYNLSEMERGEAEAFMAERTGQTCVRMYRRQDGTVLTKDCPIGLRLLRKRMVRGLAALAALAVALVSGIVFGGSRSRPTSVAISSSAFAQWIDPNCSPRYVFLGTFIRPNPPPTVIMGGCPAPPGGLIMPPNSMAASQPAESPLPEPTAEQFEVIQIRIER